MPGLLSIERITAPPGFNRWRILPAAIVIHLCIGSIYAWSIYNPALIRTLGVVTSAPDDWTLRQVVWVFTAAIITAGIAAAMTGRWIEVLGPRKIGLIAAACWGGGYLVGGAGILTHQLGLLYLGYGVIGGTGLGLGYVSPIGTLLKWFPDRRGLASGMAIMGFGGGAMIGAPLKDFLIRMFYRAPEYLGTMDQLNLITVSGRRYAMIAGQKIEVVVVNMLEAAHMILPGPEGAYVLGSGSVGVAQTFFIMGIIYLLVMVTAVLSLRIPAPGWSPDVQTEPGTGKDPLVTRHHVDVDQALKTSQFYLLWVVFCLGITGGVGILGMASTMIQDIFGNTLPGIVDAGFAGAYVVMISVFNTLGRFFWSSCSDYLGRRTTYWIYFVLGIFLYGSIPYFAHAASVNPSVVWLVCFYAATMLIFSIFGGVFAALPAYIADLFGTRHLAGIHGRLLTAWSASSILGPFAMTSLREHAENQSMDKLASSIDPGLFARTFGAGTEHLDQLVSNHTVTLAKLVEIAPAGTVDPTPYLYNSTMYLMAALLGIGLVCNALITGVKPAHYMQDD
ncbi:MAG: OFA family MFS transporter [Gammaproteobacteria bacterium]|nr:OFA family MFS transporter [Gammaproteobacteria bacterium]